MYGHGQSYWPIVPTKPMNKERRTELLRSRRTLNGHEGGNTGNSQRETPNATQAKGDLTAESVEGRGWAKGNPCEQNTRRTQGRESVHSALARIRRAAEQDKERRFTSLYHHVYSLEMLHEAYHSLKRDAAPGIDRQTWREYGRGLPQRLEELSAKLRRGAYRARPVRRSYVPKEDGRQRPIGVTALEDKVVQKATVMVLNAIYEVDFAGFSYGFRPGRSQHNALDAVSVGLCKKVNRVLDADVSGFFDALNQDHLVKFLQHRIADQRIIRLIQKWLAAGVLEDGRKEPTRRGTPQGGVISPLLGNIYLHYVFDLWANQYRKKCCRGDVIIVRYADDFVAGFQYQHEAENFLEELHQRFAKFDLKLHEDKTRLIEFGRYAERDRKQRGESRPETFDFLGFTHYCGANNKGWFVVKRRTKQKKLRQKLKEVKGELKSRMHRPVPEVGRWLGTVLTGHYNYFGVPGNMDRMKAFRGEVARLWKRSLSRRSQKGYVTWERMKRLKKRYLPVPKITHPYPDQRLRV